MKIVKASYLCLFFCSAVSAQADMFELQSLDSDTSGVRMYGLITSEGYLEVSASKAPPHARYKCSATVEAIEQNNGTAKLDFDRDFEADATTQVIYQSELALKSIQSGVFSCIGQ